jgi:RNase P subunit RPR2
MKCSKCGHEYQIKLGSKIISKGVKVLTAMTTIITISCEKCGQISQIPIGSSSFISVKQDEED